MELNRKDLTKNEKLKAVLCISFGTGIGLIVYGIFLYFHIDIYGWNLGLIFAPLAAGYAETILANRILGEDIGAISAFILFIDTTFYINQLYRFGCCWGNSFKFHKNNQKI